MEDLVHKVSEKLEYVEEWSDECKGY